ncbi:MAG: zinc ribbon domain-containing protein [Longimicrobiales bacterium]
MNDSLPALHHALVEALLQRQHHGSDQPVTVAEVYQDLIPYRNVRTSVGFALNADYEHALLKLLAGDGGYARVEPAEVQNALRLELKSQNPNVGIFRNYAACDVFVSLPRDFERHRQARSTAAPPAAAPGVGSAGVAPSGQTPVTNGSTVERAAVPAATARPASPAAAPPPAQPSAAVRAASAVSCAACKKPMPNARPARFCPHCGHDQSRRQCAGCHEPMEATWKYCVACGTPA